MDRRLHSPSPHEVHTRAAASPFVAAAFAIASGAAFVTFARSSHAYVRVRALESELSELPTHSSWAIAAIAAFRGSIQPPHASVPGYSGNLVEP